MKSMVVLFAVCAVACGSLVAPPHLPVVATYAPSVVVAPSYGYNTPLLAHSGLGYAGHGHYLYKRSLGHVYAAPAAVSHQSRVDLRTSPAVIAHAAVAPIGYATPYNYGRSYYNSAPLIQAW